jgi:hypothetical protein
MLGLSIWSSAYSLELLLPFLPAKILLAKTQYTAILSIPVFLVMNESLRFEQGLVLLHEPAGREPDEMRQEGCNRTAAPPHFERVRRNPGILSCKRWTLQKDEGTTSHESLVSRADQAMHTAKQKGRNCVVISA